MEADSRNLPESVNPSFDLMYATIGVIGWNDHVDAWMSSVARVLRPDGTRLLVELHPFFAMI